MPTQTAIFFERGLLSPAASLFLFREPPLSACLVSHFLFFFFRKFRGDFGGDMAGLAYPRLFGQFFGRYVLWWTLQLRSPYGLSKAERGHDTTRGTCSRGIRPYIPSRTQSSRQVNNLLLCCSSPRLYALGGRCSCSITRGGGHRDASPFPLLIHAPTLPLPTGRVGSAGAHGARELDHLTPLPELQPLRSVQRARTLQYFYSGRRPAVR